MIPTDPQSPDGFWFRFGQKHRPETLKLARIFAHKKFTRDQFATLLSTNYPRMSPSRARAIYDYVKACGMLAHPEAYAEGEND